MIVAGSIMIKALEHIFFEEDDNNPLPESEEDGDFNCQEFEQGGVGCQWLMECVIEKD